MIRVAGRVGAVLAWLLAFGATALADPLNAVTSSADAYVEQPHPWQMWLPKPGSPMEAEIDWLMRYVLWIMLGVVVVVGVLLAYALWRFSAKRNKVPSTITHNTPIEIIWTVVPILLLVAVIWPSIHLIFYEANTDNAYMTVLVTGHQWYWEYKYEGVDGLDYTSYMIPDNEQRPGDIRRLTVDHPLVLPIGKKVKFEITSADVLHGFYLPALGVQRYAIPGQIVTSWTLIPKAGTYYGECNQICGAGHDAMSIEVKAVSMPQFKAWLAQAPNAYSENDVTSPLPAPAPRYELAANLAR
jgi:cytochrome c oxidase subunit II